MIPVSPHSVTVKKTLRQSWWSWIPVLLVSYLTGAWDSVAADFDHEHQAWGEMLSAGVDEQGRVDYTFFQTNRKSLLNYLSMLASVTPESYRSWSRDQQLACLINLYNAQTVELVARNMPIRSIKDIGSIGRGPWGQPVVSWFGRSTTLEFLQRQLIDPLFRDRRTHFALCSAAISSPALRREPYVAERLDEQLNDQRSRFLADVTKNRLDVQNGVLSLSEVFKWHGSDFADASGSVANYVLEHLPPDVKTSFDGKSVKIRYLEFNWSLNDQRPGSILR